MRKMGIVGLVALPSLVGLALAADAPQATLKVFVGPAEVQERKDVDDATKQALKEKKKAAEDARRALEKQLKDQFGKKREAWPPEKDNELYALEEAEALASADYDYRKVDLKAIADGVKDLRRALEGKGLQAGHKDHVVLAPDASAADLVVEVAGRRSGKTLPTQIKPDRCYLLFTIAPGAGLDAARFGAVPGDWRPRKFMLQAWSVARPTAERPAFTFESYNGGGNEFGCHGAAANAASAVVDKFAEDNYALLTAAH
jgi:hypothetical protein